MDNADKKEQSSMNSSGKLAARYFQRLGLDPAQLDPGPTIEKLRVLQEAHLANIPFENLSQHGCPHPAVMDMEQTAVKVLDKNRGGFCFELNGLFAELLEELGYEVCRVPSFVYFKDAFMEVPLHLSLVVSCTSTSSTEGDSKTEKWLVDVGLGEPSLHPLLYDSELSWDQEQVTPEGMQSKIVRVDDEVQLKWYRPEVGQWVDRLKWSYKESLLGSDGPQISSFTQYLDMVLDEASVFSQKVICCLIKRDVKLTMAGKRLKKTGPPRFQCNGEMLNGKLPDPIVEELDSDLSIQKALFEDFGIPLAQTKGLSLAKSGEADPALWEQM